MRQAIVTRDSKGWRKLGYKTIFRAGRVYLYRDGAMVSAPVDRGDWMHSTDLSAHPWVAEDVDMRGELGAVVRDCYCDCGVGICDFCSGVRLVDGYPSMPSHIGR
jgi:hypothetical protein